MKRFILYCILSICLIPYGLGQAIEKEGISFRSHRLGRQISYSVILPEDYYISTARYPVLYLFHGIGGDSSTWLEYGNLARLMDRMVKTEGITPFIMLIPDGYNAYYSDAFDGSFPYETFFTKEFVPYIDRTYRTLDNPTNRAIAGFSMGGFGALTVSMRNKDMFRSVIALAPSIRTDKQYSEEMPQEGWDSQWGRIFGAKGESGAKRLTSYYKARSPYHIILNSSAHDWSDFHIFMDVGDKEGTLAASNDELHKLLLSKQIPHHWHVRSGGHDFYCWNEAMPSAFRFLNTHFSKCGKPTVSDHKAKAAIVRTLNINVGEARLYMPAASDSTNRKYPVIYVLGNQQQEVEMKLEQRLRTLVDQGATWPVILCFVPTGLSLHKTIIKIEEQVPQIRNNQRMRALVCVGDRVSEVVKTLDIENLFTGMVWVNPDSPEEAVANVAQRLMSHSRYPRCWFEVFPQFPNYGFGSSLRLELRKHNADPEFRSRASIDNDSFFFWEEWLDYLNNRIHY